MEGYDTYEQNRNQNMQKPSYQNEILLSKSLIKFILENHDHLNEAKHNFPFR